MTDKILIVDNDSNLLEDYEQRLHKQFHVFTALDAGQAIELADDEGPFAVIVTNLHLHESDGLWFLTKLKKLSPHSVYMILTDNSYLQKSIEAFNAREIFCILSRPCTPETLVRMIETGLEEYRLKKAEREKEEKTLRGGVKVLCEIMSLVSPQAFSRAMRIKDYVRHIANQLELPELWQFEAAAMLSQVGCVTMPPDILSKAYGRDELTISEKKMFASHPSVAYKLLSHVPGLEKIARMIEGQMRPFKDYPPLKDLAGEDRTIALGSQMLKVTLYFEQIAAREVFREAILDALCKTDGEFNPKLLTALANFKFDKVRTEVIAVTIRGLETGMITDEDIKSKSGILLLPKGIEVTYTALERLRNFSQDGTGVKEPFRVRIPSMAYQAK